MSNGNSTGEQHETNRPAQTIRYGAIKATIWRNSTRNGTMYSTTVTRSFKGDNDEWRESHSFGPSDLPTVSKALLEAHTWVKEQMARDREQAQGHEPKQNPGKPSEPSRR